MNKEGMFILAETSSDNPSNFQTIDMHQPKPDLENQTVGLKVGSVSSEDVKQLTIEEPEKLNTINEPILDTLVNKNLINRKEIYIESVIR
jgi:hypothetical protein